ncbi:hypothetical protein HMPREF9319_0787 [Streptococcus equinus ATCC 700338]|uniref:Uncharacterized protein n=1 Tax=Streptococcus equinus ATCC 700338 TaxID=864569 RepID=E0PD64_STREI|nr:hypothetical protein HMPREF9319_0787 [Streptococcus equinus ATCC 700338]KXI13919.1 hypothetical protein HMPREF3205_00566 [Streptococcus pasteurianus]
MAMTVSLFDKSILPLCYQKKPNPKNKRNFYHSNAKTILL